uniref:G-protein coupled receptors family 1 profile domain-containing protein n=1 Tax=Acrobeloides nanus TaxID=290746 RepID=A0A914DRX1_9BILA
MKRCIHLMIISWIIFAFIVVFTLSFMALVKIDFLREWSGCKSETCLRYMFRMRNFFTVTVYLLTIICFLLTVVFINRARRFVSSFSRRDKDGEKKVLRHRFPLWKLAVNVATFAILHGFYAFWGAGTLILIKDSCFWIRNSPMMTTYLGYIRATLLIRIIIDPIISFITDYQIRRIILSILCVSPKISPQDSRKNPYQTSKSEENSSETNQANQQAMHQRFSVRTRSEEISSRKTSQELF